MVALSYDANLAAMVTITDAIGQVTIISYDKSDRIFKITKVTDPFGRFATFDYDDSDRLIKITDVIGITSQFTYDAGDFIINADNALWRSPRSPRSRTATPASLETIYPDGDRDRVEYNQSTTLGVDGSVPASNIPGRYGDPKRVTLITATPTIGAKKPAPFAYGDYTKAKIYHWLHTDRFDRHCRHS